MKNLFLELLKRIVKHDVNSYAAQSAYYLLLGFFPFFIVIVIIVTSLGINYMNSLDSLFKMFPAGTLRLIKDYLSYSKGFSSKAFSPLLVTAILISSKAMTSLIKAFNIANDSDESRSYFWRQLISLVSLLLVIVMFTISLSISTISGSILNKINDLLGLPLINSSVYNLTTVFVNLIGYIVTIGLIYYILPVKKYRTIDILPGTIFSSIMLATSTYLFGYFVTHFTRYSVVYGSLSSVVILLMWLYVCSFILIIGEEINVLMSDKKAGKLESITKQS